MVSAHDAIDRFGGARTALGGSKRGERGPRDRNERGSFRVARARLNRNHASCRRLLPMANEPPAVPCAGSWKQVMSAHAGVHARHLRVHRDLVSALRSHARERADQVAFSFLCSDACADVLTYAQLDQRARAVAARLQGMNLAGQRVVLAYPHGLDFIIGFFACLYAGCVAVPTCPPRRRTLEGFHAIVADADARVVLSTGAGVAQHRGTARCGTDQTRTGPSTLWLATDEVPPAWAERWTAPDRAPEALAMLQYTSGSTSQPKGVMLSHANLVENSRAIHAAFEVGQDSGVCWLPPYHDMGLVGGILEPLLAGIPCALMSPAAFLRCPMDWLTAISTGGATISGGPNFAYDLCVRRTTPTERATLDLSCWSLAFVGAEPVQAETLERFAEAFAPCGFKASAFYPCYGLAEATLLVTGGERGGGAAARTFDGNALAHNRVELVEANAVGARRLVACGSRVGDGRMTIVDMQTLAAAGPGRVGEVWVSGPSVGLGYWGKTDASRACFNAHLSDTGEGPFLRTGDLGFVVETQLHIVGRADDMLIIRGRTLHPQDVEATARQSHARLQEGLSACFALDDAGQRLALVHEVARDADVDAVPVITAARRAVVEEHGIGLEAVVLVRQGTLPRTSSGKVQRRACRAALLAGELSVLAQHQSAPATGERGEDARVAGARSESDVLATVCQHALAVGGAALADVTPHTPLAALGLDSLQRVELAATLEKTFGCRIPDTDFNAAQTLGELAHAVQQHLHDVPAPDTLHGRVESVGSEQCEFVRFAEYAELKRYEHMVKAVAGENPYFRVDEGGTSSACYARIAGRDLVNFCVYDYIGLAHHPHVAAAAKAAIDRYGTSAGASRLVSGEKQVHRDLERALAAFLGTASALVFVSGHATNVTTIGHLLGPEDLIVYDALAHNSILQGAQLSGATRRAFAHNDASALDALLSGIRHRYRRVLIAIEGVYSMDGDYPDLPRFIAIKKKHRALMLVDEAHSLGTMGSTGRGIGEHWGVLRADVDLWMGTLSKSLASCGGYIAGSAELVEYLAYTAPGFVYSVGLSPPNAAAALAALHTLGAQPERVGRLRELAALFLALAKAGGLNTGTAAGTPVIPIIIGNSVKSLRLARALFDRGINAQPILPPAVQEHSARLRFFITLNHTEAQVRDAVSAVADELAKL
ncbi:MAG: aminotransferase class I/II-fold pyridoxal phosphate-dependent enzyme [Phycisphaerales bacterium]